MQTTIRVGLKGITPLLMHRYPMEPIEAIEKKPAKEQAEFGAYRMSSGELYIPGINVQCCLVAGASYVKGKGRASMQKPAAACIQVTPEHLGLGTKTYEIDARPTVIPATRGRVIRYRPRLNTWAVEFDLEFDDALVSHDQMRQIADNAFNRCGLLDYRPAKRGPFGRAMIVKWESQ